MSMTDPIADLLTRIRNGQTAKHEVVQVPKSRMKLEIVKILREEGYIDGYEESMVGDHPFIGVRLRYDHAGTKAMSGLVRVSRPGRRVYCGKAEIPKVLNGLGVTILSTSRGVMTGAGCRKAGVGGEILCNIW